jgi:ribonucleoside-diphosphate reductase alpha chain
MSTHPVENPRGEARPAPHAEKRPGLTFRRHFTRAGRHPYDEITWELRSAVINDERGQPVFEQHGIEVPSAWSQTATNIVASKYFRGQLGAADRERSVRGLISRVVDTIRSWGEAQGYFATPEDLQAFAEELAHLLVQQKAAFNSPVWFNVGIEKHPQSSACFINAVQDTMESILGLARTEGMLFKFGSGTGSNLSNIRSSKEPLAGGGTASGPVSFMRGYDAFAGVIKSGGKTRRAAKMVILNSDHPDVVEFIHCKADEEKKAWALIDAGYDGAFNVRGGAYDSVFFQNANHSVRVTDEFMRAVLEDREWQTRYVLSGEPCETFRARDLMKMMADAAWQCGDPGIQYDTTVNDWHTCPNTARINASNPCVTGDTLVATAEGWRRIDSLVGRTARVIGLDGSPHVVTRVFPTGRKPVFRLRTRAGYEVRITADHRVWTVDRGDVAVRDLRPGDALQLQGPGFGRRALGERLALAVGVAVGDGCLTRSHASGRVQEIVTLTMAAEERGVLDRIAGVLNEAKAERRAVGAVGNPGPVHVTARGTGSRLSFSSQAVVGLFKDLAVLDEGSHRKRLTPAAFELDRASLAGLLRGLFTADGTVANYGAKSQYVSLDSTSLELLRQVQVLLLGFGIKAKLYTERRGGEDAAALPDGRGGTRAYPVREVHSLRISRTSRFVFEREIGFDPASPKAAALRAVNEQFGAYQDEMADEVASVEPLGEEDVFDLTEESTEHFVANGLAVHNCSEYMFLDDTACNLASLNLMKFVGEDGEFDVEGFRAACRTLITAQEILVDNSSYPTPAIDRNSHDFRPLGLGYANLGVLLMDRGLPYDSDEGRAYAGAVTALMHGEAYAQSARLASAMGPFAGHAKNAEPMLRVIDKHRKHAHMIDASLVPRALLQASLDVWDEAYALGAQHGYRNSQVTVLAPTGTIGFMMDCDTTGIEPDIALVKYKKLVGGGVIKIVNQSVPGVLRKLGYTPIQVEDILRYVDEREMIEGAPHLRSEHLAIFDCAFPPRDGKRSIHWMGHIKMMAAVQPFLSGAISKTVNMPTDATPEDIQEAYVEGWKLGLKAIAVYRDGCKRSQPLSTSKEETKGTSEAPAAAAAVPAAEGRPARRKLPDERHAITHKFQIAGHEGYITVGMYEDGKPGEIFLVMAKEGSTISGLMDAFATSISMALQYGVPLEALVEKFSHVRFEPSGFTKNPEIPYAKSITDYIFRWLASKFLSAEHQEAVGVQHSETSLRPHSGPVTPVAGQSDRAPGAPAPGAAMRAQSDAPPCHYCGSIMIRNGSCYRCGNCGSTSGCS